MKWWPKILLAVCVIVGSSAALVWYSIHHESVSPSLKRGVLEIVKQRPSLQPMLDTAQSDGTLTMTEANAIIDAAEKLKALRAPVDQ